LDWVRDIDRDQSFLVIAVVAFSKTAREIPMTFLLYVPGLIATMVAGIAALDLDVGRPSMMLKIGGASLILGGAIGFISNIFPIVGN
jgi:hypothetical protein